MLAFLYEETLRKIQSFVKNPLKNGNYTELKSSGKITINNKVKYIELQQYFNNKAFLGENSNNNADLTYMNEAFCFSKKLSGKILSSNKFNYKFPLIDTNYNDNIKCEKQEIKIAYSGYKNLFILACSVWGNYYENFLFKTDSKIISKKIWIDDITSTSVDATNIVWSGQTGFFKNGILKIIAEKANLFSYIVSLPEKVQSIQLPNNPNIHIFALSLA